jgi:2-dehydro-3-deoxygluconokinase
MLLFQTDEPEDVALALGGERELVVTRGRDGAVVVAGNAQARVEAPPLEVVDAAGAGDALAAAYLCARLEGIEPRRALEHGVAAASLSCLGYGCALSFPEASSVVALATAG